MFCQLYFFYTQQLEDAREPVEDPLLLDGTPGPLESDPLLGEHLHLARLLQPQDAPAQLLSVRGACNFSSDNLPHHVNQHQYNLHQLIHHFLQQVNNQYAHLTREQEHSCAA